MSLKEMVTISWTRRTKPLKGNLTSRSLGNTDNEIHSSLSCQFPARTPSWPNPNRSLSIQDPVDEIPGQPPRAESRVEKVKAMSGGTNGRHQTQLSHRRIRQGVRPLENGWGTGKKN